MQSELFARALIAKPNSAGLLDKDTLSHLSPQTIWEYLVKTLSEMALLEKTYLIIDGIDELRLSDQNELLSMIGEVVTIKFSVRILLLSRNEIQIS